MPLIVQPEPWVRYGSCRGVDPDLFFPERGASTKEAKEICRGCSVREECLDYALRNNEKFGVWGGMSERERRSIRRQLRLWAAAVGQEIQEDEDDEDFLEDSDMGYSDSI